MNTITNIISQLEQDWTTPRTAMHNGEKCPFLLKCSILSPSDKVELNHVTPLPPDLLQFWSEVVSARLFEDVSYGQWGQEIFDIKEAKSETQMQQTIRPNEFLETDLVIGRFIGDSDLLVIRNDANSNDYGSILIALPIDSRNDWYKVAPSLSIYLQKLLENQGGKYWEA